MQQIIIIAGPNGAGKTSFGNEYLLPRLEGLVFINADEIAREHVSDIPGRRLDLLAGREMLDRINAVAGWSTSGMFGTAWKASSNQPKPGATRMGKTIDLDQVQQALDRAARNARSGPAEARAGRVLPVVSSMMAGVEYDDETCELDILFSSGKTYRYFGVPADVHARLLEAASKGQFFNKEIKDAYRHAEVTRRRR